MKEKLAEESYQTKKAREKLKRKIALEEEQITKKALQEKVVEIHQWISRHARHRVVLTNKTISLFDENQHAAKTSQKVNLIAKKLRSEAHRISFSSPQFYPLAEKDET